MASSKIRYLVLNNKNEPQNPSAHGLHLKGVQNPKSPSFLDAAEAEAFLGMLSQRTPGQGFYLATVGKVAISYDKVGMKAEGRAVEITVCTPAGEGDE